MSLLLKRRRAPMLGVIAASGSSLFGNSVAAVALPWLVLDMTGSASWTGVAAAAGMLPLILGSFFGGALIDRFGARPVAVSADLASAASMALIVWLAGHEWLGLATLLALIALGALFDGPGMTAQESRYPELARLARMPLERATALNKLVGSLANIVAPAAAGLGIALFGPERTLLLTAGCSLLAAMLDRLSLPGRRLRRRSEDPGRSGDVLAGARFLLGDPLLRSLLLLGTAVVGLFGALDAVVMPVRIREAGLTASSLGWFLAAAGSGAIVGALAFARFGPRLGLRRIVLACLSLEALAFLLLTLANDEGLRLLAGVLAGLGSGPLNPLLTTVLLRRAPVAIRSRVLGASTAAALVATPLAVLLAGGAIDLTGSRPVLAVMAAMTLALLAAAALLPGLRGLDGLAHVSASRIPHLKITPMTSRTAASFIPPDRPWRTWLIASAAFLILALVVVRVWPGALDSPAAEPPLRVTTVVAGPATLTPTLRLSGTLVAREDIAIGTALQDQRVAEVHVDVGEHVRRGQRLARLETSNVQAQLQQAEAALSRARAVQREQQALEAEARATLARIEPLASSGAVSAQQVDEQRARASSAAANVQAARADVRQAQAQVADQRSQRGKADILAPVDGVISARSALAGALAGAEPLFRLIGDDEIELDAEATAADLAQLAVGMAARLRIGDTAADVGGTVRLITPALDPRTRLGRVRIAIDAAGAEAQGWRAGSHVEARFPLPAQTLPVTVPARAVTTDAERHSSVMLVDEQGRVSQRAVTPGRRQGDLLEIVAGLQPGERVVREAIAFVRDGDVVTIANDREDGHTR